MVWQRRAREMWGRVLILGRCELDVSLRRTGALAAFTRRDEAWLGFALHHAARALDRACRYAAARRSAQLLAAALEAVPWPVVVLGEQGAILFRNRAALPPLSRGELAPSLATAAAALCELPQVTPTAPVPVTDAQGWQVCTLRLPDGSCGAIVSRPATPAPAAPETHSALTGREREVAALVAHGLTNCQIALALAITDNTVKRHLKSAFRKLKITSRVQLAAQTLQRQEARP